MPNDYGRLIETWKADLILARARRKKVRPDELEDVQQELVLAVLGFRFDPRKANGATEATALTALIDRRLAFFLRGQARRCNREARLRRECGSSGTTPQAPSPDLSLDVRDAAVSRLDFMERRVCERLARGDPCRAIARGLGLSRYAVNCLVQRIRGRLIQGGFPR